MDPSKEYDTDHTDDSYDMVNKSDQSSDESFEIVGSEESYNRTTDFEENENHRSGAKPSGLGTNVLDEGYPNTDDSTSGNEDSGMKIEDTLGYPPEHSVQVYQSTDNPTSGNEDSDIENEYACSYPPEHSVQENTAHFYTPNYVRMLRFPKGIRRREDMRLRDVVEEHALRFLPAKSVCRFKAVSREWRDRIARPIFPYEQSSSFRSTSGYFNKYFYSPQFLSLNGLAYGVPSPTLAFLPESVDIRSSCNGLLLCQSEDGKYYVCNPVTKEWDVLPQPKFYHGEVPRAVLTFDPERNFEASYQVICPFTEFGDPYNGFTSQNSLYFEIYSSVTRMWEFVDVDCIKLSESEFKDNGFYANGVSYWETLDGVLLAFDMKDKFYLVQEIPKQIIQDCTMSFMEGEICYVSAYVETGNTCVIDIHAGFSMNLKRSFNVELPFVLRGAVRGRVQVLPCVNGDCLACVVGDGAFAFYPKDKSVVVIREYGIEFGTEFVPYVNSLVPLLPV